MITTENYRGRLAVRARKVLVILGLMLLPLLVYGTEYDDRRLFELDEAPTVLWVEYGRDSQETDDAFISLSTPLGLDAVLTGALGKTVIPRPFDPDLDTTLYLLGIEMQVTNLLGLNFSFETWGKSGDLTTETLSGGMNWFVNNSVLSITSQFRDITFYTQGSTGANRIETSGNGLLTSYAYYSPDGWDARALANFYSYSFDLALLDFLPGTVLTTDALDLSFGFLEHNYGLEAGYLIDDYRLAAALSTARSAVDDTDSVTLVGKVDYTLREGHILQFQLGRTSSGSGDLSFSSVFGRIGLGYRW